MRYIEFGKEHQDVIVLLHGGGLSWWNYREAAKLLQNDYRVALPILDGHAGSDRGFVSIEDNAERIIAWIDEQFGGSVLLMGGLSLGGQILLEILAKRKDICRYAWIESACVIPSKPAHALIEPTFAPAYGLIRQRWFAKLQFRALHMQSALFDDYYRDSSAIAKRDLIAFLKASTAYTLKPAIGDRRTRAHVFVGEREARSMRRSADMIAGALRGRLHVLPDLYHGEFSLNHADTYARAIRTMIEET